MALQKTENVDKATDKKEDEKKKKEEEKVINYANDYKPYWDIPNDVTKKTSSDRPDFRIYISYQKRGTETAAVHYEAQDQAANQNKTEDEKKKEEEEKKTTNDTTT